MSPFFHPCSLKHSLLLLLLFVLLLLLPTASHTCVHDVYISTLEPAKAPPTDGARARRNADAIVAPIRITAIYAASNGGTDIATEAGMTSALKTVVTAAVSAALARFSELLRVRPLSGPLFAYRPCIQWDSGACVSINLAPTCGGKDDDVVISLSAMLGSESNLLRDWEETFPATGAGIPSTDTAIFVTAKQTFTCGNGDSGTLAYASYCQRASDDRPTIGRINFCPRMLPPSVTDAGFENLLYTALHELTHVLVFSSSLFNYFRDDSGVERTPRNSIGDPAAAFYSSSRQRYIASGSTISYASERGMDCSWGTATSWAAANIPYGLNSKAPSDCVARLSTPRVKAATRAFFSCDLLEGAELENQDTSAGFVQGSHWEARTLAGDYMAAYSFSGAKISPITLAVFEDSGWYTVAYSNGDKWVKGKDWGYKQGCAFALDKCSSTNTGSPPHFYFDSPDIGVSGGLCSVDRNSRAYTSTSAYSISLPSQYRYFSSPSKGGSDEAYDYCPAVKAYSTSHCMSSGTYASATYGEVVGSGSKCHVSTLNKYGSSPSASYGRCYRVDCAGSGQYYSLTSESGATATCTNDGFLVFFSGYGGSVVCGDPASLCNEGEAWVPPCSAGFGLDASISACAPCGAGSYSPSSGTSVCTACPSGSYQSAQGQTSCTVSPAGSYNPTPGGSAPVPCPQGSFQDLKGQVSCTLCFAGTFGASPGLAQPTHCSACPTGTANPTRGATAASQCTPCLAGFYNSLMAQAACTVCSPGGWCGAGATQPTPCPPGSSNAASSSALASSCLPCAAGSYASSSGSTACAVCPPGGWCGAGATLPTPCPPGSSSAASSALASSCLPCTAGTYASSSGFTACAACPAGSWCGAGTIYPTACPAGSFCPTGSSTPTLCAAGTFAEASGSLTCLTCPTGTFCPTGSALAQSCREGTFSAAGSSECTSCAAGTFSRSSSGVCVPCYPGSYSVASAPTCFPCIPGTASPLAGATSFDICAPCAAGMFNPYFGMSSCASCPAGYFSSMLGSSECQPCKSGTFAPANGTSLCSACPAGTLSPAGAADASACASLTGLSRTPTPTPSLSLGASPSPSPPPPATPSATISPYPTPTPTPIALQLAQGGGAEPAGWLTSSPFPLTVPRAVMGLQLPLPGLTTLAATLQARFAGLLVACLPLPGGAAAAAAVSRVSTALAPLSATSAQLTITLSLPLSNLPALPRRRLQHAAAAPSPAATSAAADALLSSALHNGAFATALAASGLAPSLGYANVDSLLLNVVPLPSRVQAPPALSAGDASASASASASTSAAVYVAELVGVIVGILLWLGLAGYCFYRCCCRKSGGGEGSAGVLPSPVAAAPGLTVRSLSEGMAPVPACQRQ